MMKRISAIIALLVLLASPVYAESKFSPWTGFPDYYKDYDEAIANIEAGGLSGVDAIPGDTVDDGKLDSSLINVATSIGLGVASFPNTTFTVSTAGAVSIKANVFQPYSATLADFSEGSPTGTYDLSGATITFGLEDADIPASIARDSELPTATSLHLDDVLTALGIASEDVNFGTFTGTTIDDNLTAKAIFQALETAIEGIEVGDPVITGTLAAVETTTGVTVSQYWGSDALGEMGYHNLPEGGTFSINGLEANTTTTGIDAYTMPIDNGGTSYKMTWANIIDAISAALSSVFQAADTSLTNIASNWTVDSSGNVSGMGTIEPTPTTHPQAVLYDSDAPGLTTEEKAMAYLWAEYVDGADNAENSSAGIAARAAGAWADWIKYLAGVVYIYHDLDVDGDVTADDLVFGAEATSLVSELDSIRDTMDGLGGMVYPSGTGIAVVSGGTAWGTTLGLETTPGSGTDSEVYSAEAVDELVAGIEIDTINLTTLATDGTYLGITRTFTVDSSETNTAFGQAYHIDTDGELVAADADSADTAPCIGLAVEAGTGSKKVLLWGEIREDDWNWTPGGQVYLSTDPATTCGLTQTAPSGTGDQVHVIGIATSTDTILLKMIDIGEVQ